MDGHRLAASTVSEDQFPFTAQEHSTVSFVEHLLRSPQLSMLCANSWKHRRRHLAILL